MSRFVSALSLTLGNQSYITNSKVHSRTSACGSFELIRYKWRACGGQRLLAVYYNDNTMSRRINSHIVEIMSAMLGLIVAALK